MWSATSRKPPDMMFHHILTIVAALTGAGATQAPQSDLLCLNPSKLYPDQGDCRRFIRCVNRKPVSFSCPPKTAFDSESQTCIWRLHLGDCNQAQNIPIWTTAATTIRVQPTPAFREVTPDGSSNDIEEINPLGSDFEDVESVDEKSKDTLNDFEKILMDIHKQNGNSHLQSTISSSASRSQTKNEKSVRNHIEQSKSKDLTLKSSVAIPVISDVPMVTTGKDNSEYTVGEETTRGDNSKYMFNEEAANGGSSMLTTNEVSTKFDGLTESHDTSRTDTPTVNLQQTQQLNTAHQRIVETDQANPGNSENITHATTNHVSLGTIDESSKSTPEWMTIMNDHKTTTTELLTLNDNLVPIRDSTTLVSANMEAKEVAQLGETTAVYTLNLPKVTSNMAETSTSAEITKDNSMTRLNSEQDEKSVDDVKSKLFILDVNDSPNEQRIERDGVIQESNVDAHGAQFPQNTTEATGNTEEGFTEDNITAILTPFSAMTNLETNEGKEVLARQRLHRAEKGWMPLERYEQHGESFKSRKYTHPEDLDVSINHGIQQPQLSASSNDSDNIRSVTKTDDATKIEVYHSFRNLSKHNDLFAVNNDKEIETERYHKQTFEVKHNASRSTDNTAEATTSSNNMPVVTKPHDELKFRGKSSEQIKEQVPKSKRTTNKPAITQHKQSHNSTDLNSYSDFSTLTSRSSLANRTHVTAAAGVSREDKFSNSRTTQQPSQTEGKLNASFMSVPYMIKGLVRPFRCPEPNGHFIDPQNCSVFYHCSRGQAYRRDCPPGQVFHLAALSCVSSNLAPPCKKMDKPQEEDDYERQFRCEKDGYYRDAKQCNVYYICASGNSMRMTCDPGTSFDVTYNLCLWNSEVRDCNKPKAVLRDEESVENLAIKKVLPDLSKSKAALMESDLHLKVTELPVAQFVCPDAHGLYPDPNNCSVFIHCFKKIPYRHTCQAGTVFSVEMGACTWRELVPECQAEATKTRQEETKINSLGFSQSRLPNPDVVPEPYKQLPPNPEVLDNGQQGPPGEVPDFICPETADGFYRDNLFCDIFHRCVSGTRFTFTCPSGTFFKLRGNLCDFWENVADCTKDGLRVDAVRSLPEIATLPVPQPLPSELDIETIGIDADPVPCPESSGLFAHPRNCRQFLFCAQFIPLVLTCPESLLYNPLTLTCDLSKNVQCLRYDDYRV